MDNLQKASNRGDAKNIPQTLLFDIDNTLINRNQVFELAIRGWLQSRQLDFSAAQCAELMIADNGGYGDRAAFYNWFAKTFLMEAFGMQLTDEQRDALHGELTDRMIAFIEPDVQLNDIIVQLTVNKNLLIASNGGAAIQERKLKQAGLYPYFSGIYISGAIHLEKPDPAFYQFIIEKEKLNPANAMMIGDDIINDIAGAKTCGFHTCWVRNGKELSTAIHPDIVIRNIHEIATWL